MERDGVEGKDMRYVVLFVPKFGRSHGRSNTTNVIIRWLNNIILSLVPCGSMRPLDEALKTTVYFIYFIVFGKGFWKNPSSTDDAIKCIMTFTG